MITLSVNGGQFKRQLSAVAERQLPFALALALTRTAEEAVQREIADLPTRFHIRNSWVAKGFRVERATKTKQVATIRHKDPYMYWQEFGGEKTPLNAGSVAVPEAARPTPQSLTPRSKWPGRINRRFFIRKGDTVYEFQRQAKRGRPPKHKPKGAGRKPGEHDPRVKLMYVLKPSVGIKPRLGLVDLTRRTIGERFGANFDGFLAFAIRTAK